MYCQSCGASNSQDARFCNMCGTRIASAGSPAGPVGQPPGPVAGPAGASDAWPGAEAAAGAGPTGAAVPPEPSGPQPGSHSGAMSAPAGASSNITLARIGVRSSGKVWGLMGAVAVALIAVGSVGTWVVMALGGDESSSAGRAQPDDPFVIGTPLPSGAEAPDEDFVDDEGAGAAEGSRTGTGGPGRNDTTGGGARSGRDDAPRTTVGSSTGSTPTASAGGEGRGTGSAGSGSGGGGGSGSGSGGSGAGSGGSGTADKAQGSGSDSSGDATGDEGAGDVDVPEERDIGMDLYGARVRYVVRRYYASRAQSCFSIATRNNPTVSGTVVIGMTIDAEGQVTDTSVVRNTTGDDTLPQCLEKQVGSWKLPPPPESPIELQMPFSR